MLLSQAPSPQRKKEPPQRENKLRLFLKRSSEPLLNLQNSSQQVLFPIIVQHRVMLLENNNNTQKVQIENGLYNDFS